VVYLNDYPEDFVNGISNYLLGECEKGVLITRILNGETKKGDIDLDSTVRGRAEWSSMALGDRAAEVLLFDALGGSTPTVPQSNRRSRRGDR
jgi:hypothetical protein